MTDFFPGQQRPSTPTSEYNADRFHILGVLNRVSTATLVKVNKVTGGGNAAVGTVNVTPLVNTQDGNGKQYKHTQAFNLPYFRLQGGKNAVVMDPKVDDIGVAVFADRDISSVKRTKKQGPPGSRRRFSMADGLFFPCFLGDKPDNRVEFADGDKIFVYQKDTSALVITKDYVQMKNKNTGMHVTIDVRNNVYVVGDVWTVGADPNPNEPPA